MFASDLDAASRPSSRARLDGDAQAAAHFAPYPLEEMVVQIWAGHDRPT